MVEKIFLDIYVIAVNGSRLYPYCDLMHKTAEDIKITE